MSDNNQVLVYLRFFHKAKKDVCEDLLGEIHKRRVLAIGLISFILVSSATICCMLRVPYLEHLYGKGIYCVLIYLTDILFGPLMGGHFSNWTSSTFY